MLHNSFLMLLNQTTERQTAAMMLFTDLRATPQIVNNETTMTQHMVLLERRLFV